MHLIWLLSAIALAQAFSLVETVPSSKAEGSTMLEHTPNDSMARLTGWPSLETLPTKCPPRLLSMHLTNWLRWDDNGTECQVLNPTGSLFTFQCPVSLGKVGSNYKLKGHRQAKSTACPGNALYSALRSWNNYIRIDHRTCTVHFGTELAEAQSYSLAEGPHLQDMPSEQIRTQLMNMFQVLNRGLRTIHPDKAKIENNLVRGKIVEAYHSSKQRDHQKILNRQKII
eukprot:maker-scaffold152_size304267-snap-gene-1.19 protein:Tk10111 transcript:maker-scaffold152_size304267-snap-gene-1.19-mRNA-1 annotation:"eukaryotic translation initiation factor 3 subunit a"